MTGRASPGVRTPTARRRGSPRAPRAHAPRPPPPRGELRIAHTVGAAPSDRHARVASWSSPPGRRRTRAPRRPDARARNSERSRAASASARRAADPPRGGGVDVEPAPRRHERGGERGDERGLGRQPRREERRRVAVPGGVRRARLARLRNRRLLLGRHHRALEPRGAQRRTAPRRSRRRSRRPPRRSRGLRDISGGGGERPRSTASGERRQRCAERRRPPERSLVGRAPSPPSLPARAPSPPHDRGREPGGRATPRRRPLSAAAAAGSARRGSRFRRRAERPSKSSARRALAGSVRPGRHAANTLASRATRRAGSRAERRPGSGGFSISRSMSASAAATAERHAATKRPPARAAPRRNPTPRARALGASGHVRANKPPSRAAGERRPRGASRRAARRVRIPREPREPKRRAVSSPRVGPNSRRRRLARLRQRLQTRVHQRRAARAGVFLRGTFVETAGRVVLAELHRAHLGDERVDRRVGQVRGGGVGPPGRPTSPHASAAARSTRAGDARRTAPIVRGEAAQNNADEVHVAQELGGGAEALDAWPLTPIRRGSPPPPPPRASRAAHAAARAARGVARAAIPSPPSGPSAAAATGWNRDAADRLRVFDALGRSGKTRRSGKPTLADALTCATRPPSRRPPPAASSRRSPRRSSVPSPPRRRPRASPTTARPRGCSAWPARFAPRRSAKTP